MRRRSGEKAGRPWQATASLGPSCRPVASPWSVPDRTLISPKPGPDQLGLDQVRPHGWWGTIPLGSASFTAVHRQRLSGEAPHRNAQDNAAFDTMVLNTTGSLLNRSRP